VTFNLEPTEDAFAPECRDWAKVIKNILSLFAVTLAEVPAAELVVASAGGVVSPVVDAGGCSKFNTLLKESSRRVTPRLGTGGAVTVLGAAVASVGGTGAGVVASVAGGVVLAPDAEVVVLASAGGVAPSD
jgi:hypothetical protein